MLQNSQRIDFCGKSEQMCRAVFIMVFATHVAVPQPAAKPIRPSQLFCRTYGIVTNRPEVVCLDQVLKLEAPFCFGLLRALNVFDKVEILITNFVPYTHDSACFHHLQR